MTSTSAMWWGQANVSPCAETCETSPSNLVEQAGQDFAVAPGGGGGDLHSNVVPADCVYGQMDFGRGAPLAYPVLASRSTVGFAQPTRCNSGKRCCPKLRFHPIVLAEDLSGLSSRPPYALRPYVAAGES